MAQFVHVAYYDSSTALAAATDAFPNIKQHLGNLREFFKTLPNTTLMVSPHTNLRLINDVLVATTKVNSDELTRAIWEASLLLAHYIKRGGNIDIVFTKVDDSDKPPQLPPLTPEMRRELGLQ